MSLPIDKQNVLNKLHIFVQVAELKSFSAAAASLGLSKAAISRSIKQLEDNIQANLFTRTTRKVELTDEGENLLEQALHLFEEYEATEAVLAGFHKEPSGTLRILASPFFAEQSAIKIINQYLKKYPKVKVDLRIEERIPDMEKEDIDIMFGYTVSRSENVVAKHIGTAHHIFCASPQYLKKYGKPSKIPELKSHNYIEHSGRIDQFRMSSSKQVGELKLKPRLVVNSTEALKQCALNDMGIILVHDFIVKEEIKQGKLSTLFKDLSPSDIKFYVFYKKHHHIKPKIKKFIELI